MKNPFFVLERDRHRPIRNRVTAFSGPSERSELGFTCAGIVVDPDVARVADAHEGAGGVDAHGVLSAVVLPLCTLVDIWGDRKQKTTLGWIGR